MSLLLLGCLTAAPSCNAPATGTHPPAPAQPPATPRSTPLINGFSFEAPPNPVDTAVFAAMRRSNGGWTALIPFAFVPPGTANIIYNSPRQWWGERPDGIAACTKMARAQGLKIMLKPQLWIGGGTFTGTYTLPTDSSWQVFGRNYQSYLLHYARLADSLHIELLCIGTELAAFVQAQPNYWGALIDTVRSVYHGQLTYAENWDTWSRFPHWKKLDYIGVDAYFPLSKNNTPGIDELLQHWQQPAAALKAAVANTGRPILFTEFGYRSMNACTAQPWVSDTDAPVNLSAQDNAYEALFRTFVHEPWFAGGFVWKWHAAPDAGGAANNDYTPQQKPALQRIATWYAH